MMTAAIIILIVLMGILCWEDFTSRFISVRWIVISYLSIILSMFIFDTIEIQSILINISIISVLFLSVLLFSKKSLSKSIGLGDLVLIGCFTLIFSPFNFLLFLNTSFILGLLYYIIPSTNSKTIPLAGIFSALYVSIIVINILFTEPNIFFHSNFITI